MSDKKVNFPERLTIEYLMKAYENEILTPLDVAEYIVDKAREYKEYNIFIIEPTMEFIKPYLSRLSQMDKSECPLWGIPFAIKDNIDLEGYETTAACPKYAYQAKESATVVKKLIDAGAFPIGKTNLDQFATGLVGTRSPYGECFNALDPKMISGGSSSGSAVSVALGLASFSLGTDTAGSGRVPAMLNNLVGYKPPVGSWSTKGVVPACASLDCVTVFADNIGDALLVNKYARGFDEECCWSREIEDKPLKSPECIYLPKDEPEFYGTWADEYRKKWIACVERIEKLGQKTGIRVERIDYKMFNEAALILYGGAYVAERWQDLKGFVENNPGDTFPVTETILRSGGKGDQTAAKLFGNLHELQKYKHKAHILLKNAVMIMPTAGGSFTRDEVRKDPIATNSKMGLYTNHCNLLDMAAIAIPENTKDSVRPFGITVFGKYDREDIVAGFAKEFLSDESVEIAVCGLHKKGGALEYQLTELGGSYVKTTTTSANYKLFRLNTIPVKPGLVRDENGEEIEVQIYSLPKNKFGAFMDRVSEPLVIGDIELVDGKYVKGFLCQSYATKNAEDITGMGSFPI
ncbi:MAG: allophanate hydrolase [Lachnospiraceae bacterium]|nr:allophanate hydrolase [Lachnospiraceae bacterium]